MDNLSLFYQIFNLSHKSSFWDSLMIFGAVNVIYLTVILMVILAIFGSLKEKKVLLLAIVAVIVTLILTQVIRIFFYEPRPFLTLPITTLIKHPTDASFPSGHSSIMAALAFPYFFYKSKYSPIFLFLMLWVGVSRIFVGVHYPLDVVGGFVEGYLATGIAWKLKNLSFLK